jgi:hypothetical protein
LLVSGQAHNDSAGDLALRIEDEQKAGRIASREYRLILEELSGRPASAFA